MDMSFLSKLTLMIALNKTESELLMSVSGILINPNKIKCWKDKDFFRWIMVLVRWVEMCKNNFSLIWDNAIYVIFKMPGGFVWTEAKYFLY